MRGEYILLWLFASELRNYLRVRGEYEGPGGSSERLVELPPRARRIREWLSGVGDTIGTTSACAENTRRLPGRKARIWNYLRVRGEYSEPLRIAPHNPELPPRARRIQPACCARSIVQGTTSACAENTSEIGRWHLPYWNYLRVRGEYTASTAPAACITELPPRARRIQETGEYYYGYKGTTSACAENTSL